VPQAVRFLDWIDGRRWATRTEELTDLPLRWLRIESRGIEGYVTRVWVQERPGTVYREQRPHVSPPRRSETTA
jgi:hypothetical protein